MKVFLAFLAAVLAGGAWWLYSLSTAPPELAFVRVTRQKIESVVTTNGKVEPVDWAAARAEREGLVSRVPVAKGQNVAAGATIAVLDSGDAAAELAAAEARIDQVKAEIATLEAGGRGVELAEIENGLRRAAADQQTARREIATLERLVEKKAAPRQELVDMRERLEKADLQIRALEDRRRTLVERSSVDGARARLREMQANADAIKRRMEKSIIRAPIAGVVYALDAKPGAWLAPGAVAANIGRVDRVKVIVYVDEPELGRVEIGMPVKITWDALANKSWQGTVEKKPSQVVALNTRQVGEVTCLIDNPGGELLPGTNINAFIESRIVASALAIPKETLRREGGALGVFVLDGDRLAFRAVTTGVSGVTRTEVLSGLKEGDAVLLPTETNVKPGLVVKPVVN